MSDSRSGENVYVITTEDPRSGSSLVPMLVGAMVMIVVGMIAVWALA